MENILVAIPLFSSSVIEYQERGLPYAHIVLRLQNASHVIKAKFDELTANWDALSPGDKMSQRRPTIYDVAAFWVDKHIRAEMPKIQNSIWLLFPGLWK